MPCAARYSAIACVVAESFEQARAAAALDHLRGAERQLARHAAALPSPV